MPSDPTLLHPSHLTHLFSHPFFICLFPQSYVQMPDMNAWWEEIIWVHSLGDTVHHGREDTAARDWRSQSQCVHGQGLWKSKLELSLHSPSEVVQDPQDARWCPCIQDESSYLAKPFWKHPSRHTQSVSMGIGNPIKLSGWSATLQLIPICFILSSSMQFH